jgi:hypothetical protein
MFRDEARHLLNPEPPTPAAGFCPFSTILSDDPRPNWASAMFIEKRHF